MPSYFSSKTQPGRSKGCGYEERQHGTHADGNAIDHKSLLYWFRRAFLVVLITYSTCRFPVPFLLRPRPLSLIDACIAHRFNLPSEFRRLETPLALILAEVAGPRADPKSISAANYSEPGFAASRQEKTILDRDSSPSLSARFALATGRIGS